MQFIDPTQKEIMAEQKAFLKGKSFKYKFDYFIEYYLKTTLIIAVALAVVISIIVTVVSQKETACQILFVNSMNTPDSDEYAAYAGIDTKEYEVIFDGGFYIDVELADNTSYVNLQKLVALISAKDAEGIVGDFDTIYGYAASGFYGDLRDYYTEDELKAMGDKVVYYKYVDDEGNYTGETAPLFIDVTDSPLLKNNTCFAQDRVLYAIVINTQRPEQAKKFYEYLYTE